MADKLYSVLLVLIALHGSLQIAHCVSHKEKHYRYIQDVLNEVTGDVPPFIVQPPPLWFRSNLNRLPDPYHYLRPTLLLWDPVSQRTLQNGLVTCPRCDVADICLRPAHWKDGRNERNAPRLLFARNGVTYLVSRVYRCCNGHEIVAHDDSILKRFPSKEQLPFLLSHVCGITRDLYKDVVLYSSTGMKIEQIECLIAQQHLEYFVERREMFENEMKCQQEQINSNASTNSHFPISMPDDLKAPSNDFICQCIIHDYQQNEMLYTQCMAQTRATWISCDHTFKVAANIGLLRQSDQKWEKQYDSMFCILNEDGIVLSWQLTKGTAFDNIRDLLNNLKGRFDQQNNNVKLCIIDNCCAWRGKLQDVFGSEMLVKLDLFHAVQRVVKCIPKRHPFAYRCCQAFRLVFRDPSDAEEKRSLQTPSPQVMMDNINKFLKTWKDISHGNQAVLTVAAIKEIEKLKKHVTKGCLSYIAVGCGSERNENLHKCLQQAASKGRIGVALAVALLTSFLYKWNEKQAAKRKGSKSKVLPPITSRKAELLNGETGLTKEKFGIGISKERTDSMASLPAAYEQCSNSLSEMQDIMGRAFDDQLETGELTAESEEEGDSNVKDIETDAFTRALNLYFLTTDLPEIVNSAVNTDHFHLMATHALFGFGTMSSHIASDTASTLENLLSSYNFARIQVAPDGDCLFSSVIFQLKQMVSSRNAELLSHLEAIGFHTLLQGDNNTAVAGLRNLMVSEMLENRADYEGYITNDSVEYEEQVKNFKQFGVYSGEIGNVMALSLTNVLRVNMVLFTSMDNFPLIPLSPFRQICTHQTLYLAFNHLGSGHYDPVVEVAKATDTGRDTIQSCEQARESNPSSQKKKPGVVPVGEEQLRRGKYNLRVIQLTVLQRDFVSRPDYSQKKGQLRKREKHSLQNVETNSLKFMQSKEERPVEPKWTKLEHILVEVIVDLLIERVGEAADRDVCKVFNNIVSIADSAKEINVPVSNKAERSISRKIKSIKDQAVLFRQFYLRQVERNLSDNEL
ncbi:hypothetical protein OS493_012993 [Desmophyllum pertusum]|uniref:OTU domain-containing protein n=1 Tax=Desmophyllum pertusum TaxID=174260 RepID=A0A9W9Z1P8_9CNID|nr:hypothetical protein OS493_012993 [Desmophyllum pertusum]